MNKEIFRNMIYHIIGLVVLAVGLNTIFYLFFSFTNGQDINKFRELKQSAEAGNSRAQFKLVKYYFEGKGGVQKDTEEALKWCRKSAEQGYGEAELTLSNMYDRGLVVEENKIEAKKWLKKGLKDIGFVKFLFKGGLAVDNGGDAFTAINNIRLFGPFNSDWLIIITTIIFFVIWATIKIDRENTNNLHRIIILFFLNEILCYVLFAFVI